AGRGAAVRERELRRGQLHLSAALRGRSRGDDARARAGAATRRADRVARVRRPVIAARAGGLARVHRSRPPATRARGLARVVRGRPVPRPEHPRVLRPQSTRGDRRNLARGGPLRRRRAPDEPRRRSGHGGDPRARAGSTRLNVRAPRTRARPAGVMRARAERPAFYAVGGGRIGDAVALLHPPYTAWHLSYFALGAAAAPHVYAGRTAWGLAAFALAVGIAAHALDEWHDRPLGTRFSDATLVSLAALSLAGALAIGVGGIVTVSAWLAPF